MLSPGLTHLLLKLPDAAKSLQISDRQLHALAKAGVIPVVRIGRSVRFDVRDLVAFIDSRKSPSKNTT